MKYNILLAGDGGQGIQTIAEVICKTIFEKGLHVSLVPNYGLEQRGGASLAYIIASDREISYPKFSLPDFLLIMSDLGRERTGGRERAGVKIIDVKDFNSILSEKRIQPGSYNIFFLGVLAGAIEEKKICSRDEVRKVLEEKLNKKHGWIENERAFIEGCKI